MSDAIAGVGAQFKRGDGTSSEEFIPIAEVISIPGPPMSRDTIDVTNLDSTGGYREFKAGFRDGGEFTIGMNFTLDTYNQMKDDFEDDDSHNYQIVIPDTGESTLEFAAYVTGLSLNIVADDKITADVTLKITGQVSLST